MSDFFEIDFLKVEASKSGDAISVRYRIGEEITIHVIDGGFQETGNSISSHINEYYDAPSFIDRVIVTHPDGDHAGGLRIVLEQFEVGELWMHRPWLYAEELIDRFSRFKSIDNLKKRLREIYPNIDALEKIALEKEIPIYEPFPGSSIGVFTVFAPSKSRYLDLIVESEKTPESTEEKTATETASLSSFIEAVAKKAVSFLKSLWAEEVFSDEETSSENEMSVIQYAYLCGKRILLTGDAGRGALNESADYAGNAHLELPGIDRFQVPHHGSRRNVSTEALDRWLGSRLVDKPNKGEELFTAIISASKKDEDHPRKAVVRAMIHRGAKVVTNQIANISTSHDAPKREGWSAATPLEYPEEQEN